ncbi:MAG: class I SAM-dependent methyltransferase [Planctomycetota bacterium]|jgi:SAM-dependent methyltransferase
MDWDTRYESGERCAGQEPAALLRSHERHLPRGGRALDVAAGAGRNAVFLARRGLSVDAVDRSGAGLARAAELAREEGVTIHTIVADLVDYDLGSETYDVVVNFHYLQRDLVPRIRRALRPGGLVVFETYTAQQLEIPGARGPSNPDFLLAPGELEAMFAGFEILFSAETVTEKRAVASLVARKKP